jgi:hypothetical protein
MACKPSMKAESWIVLGVLKRTPLLTGACSPPAAGNDTAEMLDPFEWQR